VLTAVRSVVAWGCIALVTGVFPFVMLLVFVVSLPFDRTGAWAHRVGTEWGRTIVRLVPGWRVRLQGTENLRDGPFVIVANHQSQVDILVSFFLPVHFKWLSKRSVFNIPFLGWMMWMCRYIPVRRGDRRSALECLNTSMDWIRRGVSVIFFPEGTRSTDGQLQPFKPGAFRVAAATGAPVLPVAIFGTGDCLPKGGWRFGRQSEFRVVIGTPIPSTGVPPTNVSAFAAEVHEKLKELISAQRQRDASRAAREGLTEAAAGTSVG